MARPSEINRERLAGITSSIAGVRQGFANMNQGLASAANIHHGNVESRRRDAELEELKKKHKWDTLLKVVQTAGGFVSPFLQNKQQHNLNEQAADNKAKRDQDFARWRAAMELENYFSKDYQAKLDAEAKRALDEHEERLALEARLLNETYFDSETQRRLDAEHDRALRETEALLAQDLDYKSRFEATLQANRLELELAERESELFRNNPPDTQEVDLVLRAIEIRAFDKSGIYRKYFMPDPLDPNGGFLANLDSVVGPDFVGSNGVPLTESERYHLWRTKVLLEGKDDLRAAYDMFVGNNRRWQAHPDISQSIFERVMSVGGGANLRILDEQAGIRSLPDRIEQSKRSGVVLPGETQSTSGVPDGAGPGASNSPVVLDVNSFAGSGSGGGAAPAWIAAIQDMASRVEGAAPTELTAEEAPVADRIITALGSLGASGEASTTTFNSLWSALWKLLATGEGDIEGAEELLSSGAPTSVDGAAVGAPATLVGGWRRSLGSTFSRQ